MPEMHYAVICPYTGKSLKHQELVRLLRYKIIWIRSTSNNIGRLAQGLQLGIKGTNITRSIHKCDVPVGGKFSYGSFVVDVKEHKEEN
jgi:hypothetical protein